MSKAKLWRYVVIVLILGMVLPLGGRVVIAMEEKALNELVQRLDQAPFSKDKLVILQAAAEENTFTCEQVIQILHTFYFATDQLTALQAVANRIENPEQKERIIEAFTFMTDRDKAREMLKQIKPAQPSSSGQPGSRQGNSDFTGLIQKLNKEPFGSNKLKILSEEIAQLPRIPSDQVEPILRTFDFDSDRMKAIQIIDQRILNLKCQDLLIILEELQSPTDRLGALRILCESLADVENKFILFDAFPYSADRTEAKRILEGVQSAHPLFGPFKAKRILFVIDASGSMSNPIDPADDSRIQTGEPTGESKFQYLQREVTLALREYLPSDAAFNLVLCTAQFQMFTSGLAKVTPGNVEKAAAFLQQAKATEGMPFVDILTKIMNYSDVDAIYFITDGMIAPTERVAVERMVQEMQRWHQRKKIDFYPVVLLQGGEPRELKDYAANYFNKLAYVTSGVAYIRVE